MTAPDFVLKFNKFIETERPVDQHQTCKIGDTDRRKYMYNVVFILGHHEVGGINRLRASDAILLILVQCCSDIKISIYRNLKFPNAFINQKRVFQSGDVRRL